MKKLLITLSTIFSLLLTGMFFMPLLAGAVSTFQVVQGGTGSTTLSGILIGNGTSPVKTVTIGSGCTLTGTTLACAGTGGGSFNFTPFPSYNGTTTAVGFSGGAFTNGSTTVTSVGSGLTAANNGLLYGISSSTLFGYTPPSNATTLTINGTSNQITSSAGAQDLTANRTWTLSLPNNVIFPIAFTSTYGTTTFASSTALTSTQLFSTTASTTNLTVSSAGGTPGCATFSATGLISNTNSACGTATATNNFSFLTNFATVTAATTSPLWAMNGVYASSTGAASGESYTGYFSATQPVANTGTLGALNAKTVYSAAAGNTLGLLVGSANLPFNTGGGTVTATYGEYTSPNNVNGIASNVAGIFSTPTNSGRSATTTLTYGVISQPTNSAGTTTQMVGLYNDCNVTGGSVPTCIGLYLDYEPINRATTNVGVYQTDPNAYNVFAGKVGFGSLAVPTYAVDSVGFINTSQYGGFKQNGNTVLYASTTNSSLAVGASSATTWMSATSSLFYDVAIGAGALAAAPTTGTAQYNVAVGVNALAVDNTGSSNFGLGLNSLIANISGSANVAIGVSSLAANTTGSFDTGIGGNVLVNNATGGSVTAIGYSAAAGSGAYSNTGGTYLGYLSGNAAANASDYNTFVGYQSGTLNTSGYDNLFIGAQPNSSGTGYVTTGGNNLGIGFNTRFPSATANNQLNIGNLLFGTLPATTSASAFALPSSGALGIGTSSPYAKLSVQANNGDTTIPLFAIGSSTASATTTLFSVSNIGTTTLGLFGACSSTRALTTDASGSITCGTITGGSATPAGTNGQFQYNDGSAFNGVALSTFHKTGGWLSFGTSTLTMSASPALSILGTSTAPQLLLTDNSNTNNNWFMRTIGGNFYMGTSSPSTFATSTMPLLTFFTNAAGITNIGIGSSTPSEGLVVANGGILNPEIKPATTTAISLSLASSTQQLLQIGASAVTVTLSNAMPGQAERIPVCNSASAASTVTWASSPAGIILWNGGTAPVHTTTANKCDLYTFTVSQGTSTSVSTPIIMGSAILNY